jgi:hypothetical protein
MDDVVRNQGTTLTRVHDFGAQNQTFFPADKLTGELMAIIDEVVGKWNLHAATHAASTSSARQGTASKTAAREALYDDLKAINSIAHVMAFKIPGLDDKFRMPRGGDQVWLATARAFVADATPMKADFIRYGLPADFIDDLKADIAAFEQAITTRNQSLEQKAASSAVIEDAIERGMQALRELDAIMRIILRDDVAMLNAWRTASHVERVPHRRRQPQSPPAPSTPAQ